MEEEEGDAGLKLTPETLEFIENLTLETFVGMRQLAPSSKGMPMELTPLEEAHARTVLHESAHLAQLRFEVTPGCFAPPHALGLEHLSRPSRPA
eukprot:scaffold2699_cov376-Prasinococcus_capsulatus_cf.AAC.2